VTGYAQDYRERHGLDVDALTKAVDVFQRWLYLPDPSPLYVVLATVAANQAPGDPVWLLLVGPPGSGKTELLAPLGVLPEVHPAATLTEASLLSGTPKKEQAKDAKGGLLREIGEYGIVVCKDFGSVLSMHRDARAATLSALREVYDGSWTRHVGTDGGKRLHWEGKVGLLAGCTPTIDNHAAVMGAMGERFMTYRMPDTDEDAQAARALAHAGHEEAMRAELGHAVRSVLVNVDTGRRRGLDLDDIEHSRLIQLATFAVRCRSAVERDGYTREVEIVPEPEAPGRLALTLARLLAALSTIGVDRAQAWLIVTKVALDSMPKLRRLILDHVLAQEGAIDTSDIAEALDHPTQTTRRGLEDLTAHGILRRAGKGKHGAHLWRPTDWASDRWENAVKTAGNPYATKERASFPEKSLPKNREEETELLPLPTFRESTPEPNGHKDELPFDDLVPDDVPDHVLDTAPEPAPWPTEEPAP
jgi:DeoR-like helix-turn-helix domain